MPCPLSFHILHGGFPLILPPIEGEHGVAVIRPIIKCRDEVKGKYIDAREGGDVRGDYWLVTKVRRRKIKRKGSWRRQSEGREKKTSPRDKERG